MDTKDCAEEFFSDDEFHKLLGLLNKKYGHGEIIAIVWSTNDKPGKRTGMAVCQLRDGMTSKRFTVDYDAKNYTLKFLGKFRTVQSDYFDMEMMA